MITIRSGTSIWGPFEEYPHNPILTNRNQSDRLLQNVGHGDLVEDGHGNWWLVALDVRSVNLNQSRNDFDACDLECSRLARNVKC